MDREDLLSRVRPVNENDPTYLCDVILNIVIAAKDTTATTLAWFVYMLCKNPDAQNKVAKELKEVTGSEEITNFTDFAGSLSEEKLENLHYLHASITETLRLCPAVPVVITETWIEY